jgi:hypothetical protein
MRSAESMTDFGQECSLSNGSSFPYDISFIVVIAHIVSWDSSVKQAACNFLQEPGPAVNEVTSEHAERNLAGVGAAKCSISKNVESRIRPVTIGCKEEAKGLLCFFNSIVKCWCKSSLRRACLFC